MSSQPTLVSPTATQQINRNLYVGLGYLQTIQNAVDFAAARNDRNYRVVIPKGYLGTDTVASIVGGDANITIADERNANTVYWQWNGTSYEGPILTLDGKLEAPSAIQLGANNLTVTGSGAVHIQDVSGAGKTYIGGASIDSTGNLNAGGGIVAHGTLPLDVSQSAAYIGTGSGGIHAGLTLVDALEPANNRAWKLGLWPDSGSGACISFGVEDDSGSAQPWMTCWRNGTTPTQLEITPPVRMDGALTVPACTVAGSPVRTFANTPNVILPYPAAGLAVSTGSKWGTSINPATLVTKDASGNVIVQGNLTMNGATEADGNLTVVGILIAQDEAQFQGNVTTDNLSVGGNMTTGSDVQVGGQLTVEQDFVLVGNADLATGSVAGSPIRTFANTADNEVVMIYPGAGLAVSTGSGWAASLSAATTFVPQTLSGNVNVVSNSHTLSIDGSPVCTFANTPTFVYPAAGLAVSTGSGWAASLSAATTFVPQTLSGNVNVVSNGHALTVDGAPIGGFTYPPAGVPVSTGSAWGASVNPATLVTQDAGGNVEVTGNLAVGSASGGLSGDADGNLYINPTASLYLCWNSGGTVVFGDGAGGNVAQMDITGKLLCQHIHVTQDVSVVGATTLAACNVAGSGVRTFANTPAQTYPAIGIAVSTGSAWGASLSATATFVPQSMTASVNVVSNGNTLSIDGSAIRTFANTANPTYPYPGAGLAVSTGTAWATSIDPTTIPRLNIANTFTAAQTIQGNLTVGTAAAGGQTTIGLATLSGTSDGSMSINPSGSGTLLLGWSSGSGVLFGNGAGTMVAEIDPGGNAAFQTAVINAGFTVKGTANLQAVSANGNLAVYGGTVSTSASVYRGTSTVNIAQTDTLYLLPGSVGLNGLLRLRDQTSGGSALVLIDTSGGATPMQTQINGLTVTYNNGWYVAIHLGVFPRTLNWTIYS